MDRLPLPAYDAIDLSRYKDAHYRFQYESSRGCPCRCAFCYGGFQHRWVWRAKSPGKVIRDLSAVQDRWGIHDIFFVDDNFFVDKKRALAIASQLIREDMRIGWSALIRADDILTFKDEELSLFARSGLRLVEFGVESGSDAVLKAFNKQVSAEQSLQAAQRMHTLGITTVVTFVIGAPFESDYDLRLTLDMYDTFRSMPNTEVKGMFICCPYPKNALFTHAIRSGYRPGKDALTYVRGRNRHIHDIPWISPRRRMRLETVHSIASLMYIRSRSETGTPAYVWKNLVVFTPFYYAISLLLYLDGLVRLRLRVFDYAPEWRIYSRFVFDKLGYR